ncbi:MAG: hypothetical protein VB099_20585 [Candidatus Limiplasma sp.]|nr:hypothetical protein [Candidatus Limiplasma sp.]
MMSLPVKITLVLLGTQLHMSSINKLRSYKSKIFKIINVRTIADLPNTVSLDWSYPKAQIASLIEPDVNSDITMALLENQIEGNYFMRRLGERVGVITFFQAADIMSDVNIDLLNYLLKNIYEAVSLYVQGNNSLYPEIECCHDETRRCIFDMTGNKYDVVYACEQMCLCADCEARLRKKALPANFLDVLKKELKHVRKSRYSFIMDFIKRRPLFSMLITAIASIALNLMASFLYAYITGTN